MSGDPFDKYLDDDYVMPVILKGHVKCLAGLALITFAVVSISWLADMFTTFVSTVSTASGVG